MNDTPTPPEPGRDAEAQARADDAEAQALAAAQLGLLMQPPLTRQQLLVRLLRAGGRPTGGRGAKVSS